MASKSIDYAFEFSNKMENVCPISYKQRIEHMVGVENEALEYYSEFYRQ